MDPELFRSVKAVFQEAMELSGEAREAFLDEAFAEAPELEEPVRSLLRSAEDSSVFIEQPAFQSLGKGDEGDGRDEQRIGPYRILRVIGSGGMGMVYEAEGDHPKRVVALKTVRAGLADASALKRFELETRILATLKHPGIAQIYDAGTEGTGTLAIPYFAMEYVPNARTITQFADDLKLTIEQRLKLFIRVCEAVHYGHQRGIIHRDLKPANILVDRSAGKVQPKIIDFGVARAMEGDLTLATAVTGAGHLVGSLHSMSPEQCEGIHENLDIRSDVYSLGVVLYELLCGRKPLDLTERSITEAVRIISHDPPVRPSAVRSGLKGDLETILLKALEKDRERRYGSVREMARDVYAYLHSRPIEARPPGFVYLAKLFIRRNRLAVTAAVVVLLTLVTALVVSLESVFDSDRRVARAEQRARDAERARDFLLEALGRTTWEDGEPSTGTERSENDDSGTGRSGSGIAIITDRVKAILEEEDRRPIDADVITGSAVGEALLELKLHDEAQAYLEAARAAANRESGATPTTITMLKFLEARLFKAQDRSNEAEALFREVLRRAEGDSEIADTVLIKVRLELAGALVKRVGPVAAKTGPIRGETEDGGTFRSRVVEGDADMTVNLTHENRTAEAESLLRDALERCYGVLGRNHDLTIRAKDALGAFYLDAGRHSEAEPFLASTLKALEARLEPDHPRIRGLVDSLARCLEARGRPLEAIPLIERKIAWIRVDRGEDHPITRDLELHLARIHFDALQSAEAEALCRPVLESRRRSLGDEKPRYRRGARTAGADPFQQRALPAGPGTLRGSPCDPIEGPWS